MMPSRIPRPLRGQALAKFGRQCAYCHTPTWITGGRLVLDHVIPRSTGGQTAACNLCPACHSCNESKGSQTTALDPETGVPARLFHPHQQVWREHFCWSEDGSILTGRTPTGRATVAALNANHADIVAARRWWSRFGWHPPSEDL